MDADNANVDTPKAAKVQCFFDMTIADIPIGRLVFELWKDKAPKTVENFRCLCTGERGTTSSGAKLSYQGTLMHRVIQGFMIQGGDFTKFNGTGGESIYGGRFEDEDLTGLHDRPGLLSMANAGKDTNGSQFFITCAPSPHLNGNHVIFGRVLSGRSVLRMIEREPVIDEKTHRPGLDIKVVKSGQLEEKDWVTIDEFEDLNRPSKKKRQRRRSGSSSSSSDSESSSSSASHRKRRKSPSRKRSKYTEGDESRRDRADKKEPKEPEPPKTRTDSKGRTVKGRGTVSERRFFNEDRRGGDRSRDRWDRRSTREYDRDARDLNSREHQRRRYEGDSGRWDKAGDRRPGEDLSRHRDRGSSHYRHGGDYDDEGRDRRSEHRGSDRRDDRDQSRSLTSPPGSPRRSVTATSSHSGESSNFNTSTTNDTPQLPQRTLVSYSGVVSPPASTSSSATSPPRPTSSKSRETTQKHTTTERQRSPDAGAHRQKSPEISPHASDTE